MSKNYGSVMLGDNAELERISKRTGVELDFSAVWDEARDYMDSNGTTEAEVRIKGLDYIQVYRPMTKEEELVEAITDLVGVEPNHQMSDIPCDVWEFEMGGKKYELNLSEVVD